jgi:DNA invertase Pin-like site-specific DNA recombinase
MTTKAKPTKNTQPLVKQELHIGYLRVSTADQATDRQLAEVELSLRYQDQLSGKDTNRPALQQLLKDDNLGKLHNVILHVHSLDRLGRNLQDLQTSLDTFTAKGWTVIFHKEGWTFKAGSNDAMQKLMLQMFGAFAEFERTLIRERQTEGIALAKVKGVYKGRVAALNAEQVKNIKVRAATGATKASLAKEFGISRASVYNYLAE